MRWSVKYTLNRFKMRACLLQKLGQSRFFKMGDDCGQNLVQALELDKHPLTNQFFYIEQFDNTDGSFILSTLINYHVKRSSKVILVTCHNSIGHFHSISQKLGYNLMSLKDSGEVYVIDILEKITNEDFLFSQEPLKQLYSDVKKQLDIWGNKKGVCVIVEHLGNLILADVHEIITFIGYLRSLVFHRPNSSLVISSHNFPVSLNINNTMQHLADMTVFLYGLKTGRADNIDGKMIVIRRERNYRKSVLKHFFHLEDKDIKIHYG